MKTVRKTSVFPAPKERVFHLLQRLDTLQYIAKPYATFTPVHPDQPISWMPGATAAFRFRLFGILPMGLHTIRIERFDMETGVQSREGNRFVPLWDHEIILNAIDASHTEYTDRVNIDAGWRTPFVYAWACCFYAHRQKKWVRLLKSRAI